MSSAPKMTQMFFNCGSRSNRGSMSNRGSGGSVAPVVSRSVVESKARSTPAPLLRMRGRVPIMNLSSIMTQNVTPCRSCGH